MDRSFKCQFKSDDRSHGHDDDDDGPDGGGTLETSFWKNGVPSKFFFRPFA